MDFLHWLFLSAALIFAGLAQWYKVKSDQAEEWVWFIVSEVEKVIEDDRKSEA